jgi:hypothetical protein
MLRAGLFALVLLAACAPTYRYDNPANPEPPADAPTPPIGPGGLQGDDTCGMAAHSTWLGVHESAINRASLPAGARVICATCLVTQDYAPGRLNLHLSAEGRVASMRCG